MIPRADVTIGNLTHVGMERSENQDYYGYYEPEDPAEFDRKGRLIVVCDGMGGHAGGEIASRLAVNTILEEYKKNNTDDIPTALRLSIEAANAAVWEEATQKPELKGMGSTCVSVVVNKGSAYTGHVGDSRCYLIRDNDLIQVTKDHSLVQQMVDEGLLREEEMESHPEKNVILRSLGVKPDVEVEVNSVPVKVGDIFVLSTDGLTGLVSKEEVKHIVLMHKDEPMTACARLVDLANKYGGYDNITVQIAKVNSLDVQTDRPKKQLSEEAKKHVTGTFSQEEVQKAIAEARKAAEAMAKGGGGAPAAAPPKREAPKPLPAVPGRGAAAGAGAEEEAPVRGGLGIPAVALIVIIVLAGGVFVGGGVLGKNLAKAKGEMLESRAAVPSTRVGDPDYLKATKAEADGYAEERGVLGFITATKHYEDAAELYGKLTGPKQKKEDADKAQEAMEATRRDALEVPGSRDQLAWAEAEALWDRAKKALKATPPDYAGAVSHFHQAEAKYLAAADAARTATTRKAIEELRPQVEQAQTQAVDAGADTLAPEVFRLATNEKDQAAQKSDPYLKRTHLHAALGLFKAAKLAAELKKK